MPPKKQVWVTTVDNPFDPFTQWDRWYRFDEKAGYHTCSVLARLACPSPDLSDVEYDESIDRAINDLLKFYDPFEVYVLAIEGETHPFGAV